MENTKYLNKIHQKIRYKKIRDNFIGSVGALAICLFVIISFNSIKEDLLFDQFLDSVSYYDWEINDAISTNEIYDYLIDNTCIEDYDSLLDQEILKLINEINVGG